MHGEGIDVTDSFRNSWGAISSTTDAHAKDVRADSAEPDQGVAGRHARTGPPLIGGHRPMGVAATPERRNGPHASRTRAATVAAASGCMAGTEWLRP
jgi:hypothetical protein